MKKRIAILGKGKLAIALMYHFETQANIVHCFGRETFDALHPEIGVQNLKNFSPDIICNCVVFGGIDQCFLDPERAWKINTLFPMYLAKQSSMLNFCLVHFSTDAVFRDTLQNVISYETDLPEPVNIYGMTKYSADCLISAYTDNYYIFRLPFVFGPSPKKNQFLEKMIVLGLQSGHLNIAQDIYSNAVYSMDVAHYITSNIENLSCGLYHLAGEDCCSLYDIMLEAVQLLKANIDINPMLASSFRTEDIKNHHISLKSYQIPSLRSWRCSLKEYCLNYYNYLMKTIV